MPATDPRVDAYIEKSAAFSRPILLHLRKLVHKNCPDVVEVIKWGFPNFEYKGPFCSMAAFKSHCAFGFWKTKLIPDPKGLLSRDAMGSLGKITSLKDLPSDKEMAVFIKAAMKLNEDGVKLPKPKKAAVTKEVEVPDDVKKALQKNKKALAVFEAFAPSHRKEYIQWITEAKTEETRNKRIATML
jgi:uncharacterized protein YdeI (YjbR/CyaY-like superfamily)